MLDRLKQLLGLQEKPVADPEARFDADSVMTPENMAAAPPVELEDDDEVQP